MTTRPAYASRQVWAVGLALFAARGTLIFAYKYLDDVARAQPRTLAPRLIEEASGTFAAMLLFPFIVAFARRFRLERDTWARRLPAHVAAMAAVSLTHTTMNALLRAALFPLGGLGAYDYGIMPVRYAMELPNDVLSYCTIVTVIYLFDHYRESHRRELRTSQLEARLARSQLQNLRLQLQPHFLFNTLNTISSVMYDDPRAADAMLTRLADLLRMTLGRPDAQEVTLAEELALLDLYVSIMRARFEERLVVDVDAPAELRGALVPPLLLQPLVENSIRHGLDPRVGPLHVEVSAVREGDSVLVRVRDDGPGIAGDPGAALGRGLGLSNTAARVEGMGGRVEVRNEGGLVVEMQVPYRVEAPSSSASPRRSPAGARVRADGDRGREVPRDVARADAVASLDP